MTRFSVYLKPNSKKGPLIELRNKGSLLVYVREPALGGKANDALIKLLGGYFDVPKTSIVLVRGHTSRYKVIEINN